MDENESLEMGSNNMQGNNLVPSKPQSANGVRPTPSNMVTPEETIQDNRLSSNGNSVIAG